MRVRVQLRRVAILGTVAFGLTVIAGRANGAPGTSDYTAAQAAQGAQIYGQFCATCHGSNLEGKAGPPLTGKKFQDTLQYAGMTTSQLFAFISQSMPQNAPATLSKQQYIDVLSFLLSRSSYPAGSIPLSEQRLDQVQLLPFPGGGGSVARQN